MTNDSVLRESAGASHDAARPVRASVILAALGVVFGDIGTSPLYSVQALFHPAGPHPMSMGQLHVYGVVSLIFWSVMAIVTLTYVLLVMRVDNDGEGGVMALVALLRRYGEGRPRTVAVLTGIGILGVALFFGDSMITPAISVLSAVEGLKVIDPGLEPFIIPITMAVIAALFALQRKGTEMVGRFFGPIIGGVLPALTLNYFGQGAELLANHDMVESPFFLLVPQSARIPMVLLATAATVIASQAVITGAFSVTSQAVQMGYLPRLRVRHTSEVSIGQIYVPWINGVLLVAVLLLVVSFRTSAALAYTYGMAVAGTIAITTLLFLY
ncbi:MAG: potassium transporter Kup, partial [Mycobacteriaceae bacterium]|nr:potassium transporter Kup [Mycobacteriaceae bacterium]